MKDAKQNHDAIGAEMTLAPDHRGRLQRIAKGSKRDVGAVLEMLLESALSMAERGEIALDGENVPSRSSGTMSLLNAKQTADELGVSPQTVGQWLDDGIITPEIREGRCIRFDLDKVRAQLAKRAKKAKRAAYGKHETPDDEKVPTY